MEINKGHLQQVEILLDSKTKSITADEFEKILLLNPAENLNSKPSYQPSNMFLGTLRPYQQLGLTWLERMSQSTQGVCLCDEMGLGKTNFGFCLKSSGHLVVTNSLIHKLEKEAECFLDNFVYHFITEQIVQYLKNLDKKSIHIIIIYSILKECGDKIEDPPYENQSGR